MQTISLCLIWMVIIPFILGEGIILYKNKIDNNLILAFVIGILVQFSIFQFLSIPCAYFKTSFNLLKNLWILIVLFINIIILFRYYKKLIEISIICIKKINNYPKILFCFTIMLFFLQSYIAFESTCLDDDDSNFLAKATIAFDTNTLFVYDDTGGLYNNILPERQFLSQFPHYTAMVASIVKTHPAIVAHTVFPIYFLLVEYCIFYLIGTVLFKDNNEAILWFIIIMVGIYVYGNYSRYSPFVRLICRIWQGKSVLAAIIIPFIWYCFLFLDYNDDNFLIWIMLLLAMWSSCLVSTMGIFLSPIICGVLCFIFSIKNKNIKYIFKGLLTCIPTIVNVLMYLILF